MSRRTEPNNRGSSLIENPLVASVLRENVRLADGRATIGLWDGWPFLLSELSAFGPVLAITRNGNAVLGRVAHYPEVVSVPCGHRGRAVDGSLEFDFTSWARGTAVVESRRDGWLYAIEFSDAGGEVIHKICLTEQPWTMMSTSRRRSLAGMKPLGASGCCDRLGTLGHASENSCLGCCARDAPSHALSAKCHRRSDRGDCNIRPSRSAEFEVCLPVRAREAAAAKNDFPVRTSTLPEYLDLGALGRVLYSHATWTAEASSSFAVLRRHEKSISVADN